MRTFSFNFNFNYFHYEKIQQHNHKNYLSIFNKFFHFSSLDSKFKRKKKYLTNIYCVLLSTCCCCLRQQQQYFLLCVVFSRWIFQVEFFLSFASNINLQTQERKRRNLNQKKSFWGNFTNRIFVVAFCKMLLFEMV